MKNIDIKVEKEKMVITVDLTKTHGASKTGKSVIIASSEGNVPVAPGVFMGLNVYKKA